MEALTLNQWLIVLLALVLGLFLGMAAMASGKWKGRYREEVRRREAAEAERDERIRELEAENERLRKEADEMATLRHAAARDEARKRDEEPGPL